MRKLASVQKVIGIRPIDGADRVEVCQVLGWECVTKKGEFKVGDLVVFCEVDSIMPEKPEFEFLRERKFRIKTIKLRKQISQGIVFPLSILPSNVKPIEDLDVTEVLEIQKHDPQLQQEKDLMRQSRSKSKINKFFMRFALYRFIYFKLHYKDKGWPRWISKTDEERIRVCAGMLTSRPNSEWYITEKLDGCLHESVLIETDAGNKIIKEICENKEKMLVKSFNIDSNEIEWKKISSFSIKENNNDWFKIETESGEKITLTGEHLIYLPELKCWRRIDALNGNEKILLKK